MYQIIRIKQELLIHIQTLLLQSFNYPETLAKITQKYNTNSFGLSYIGFLATTQQEEPAAYYGVFPIKLTFQGKEYLVAQSGDTMTAPAHQKKGLFIQLAKATYQLAKEQQVALVFGFPNQHSFPGFKHKLDWQFEGTMQCFTFTTQTALPLAELLSKIKQPFLNNIYAKQLGKIMSTHAISFTPSVQEKFNSPFAKMGHVTKDESFFKYKMDNSNCHLLQLNGFYIFCKVDAHLLIGEVGFFEQTELPAFIKTIHQLSRKLLCRKALIHVSENHWLYAYLKTTQTPKAGLPIGFYTIDFAADLSQIAFSSADFDTF